MIYLYPPTQHIKSELDFGAWTPRCYHFDNVGCELFLKILYFLAVIGLFCVCKSTQQLRTRLPNSSASNFPVQTPPRLRYDEIPPSQMCPKCVEKARGKGEQHVSASPSHFHFSQLVDSDSV